MIKDEQMQHIATPAPFRYLGTVLTKDTTKPRSELGVLQGKKWRWVEGYKQFENEKVLYNYDLSDSVRSHRD